METGIWRPIHSFLNMATPSTSYDATSRQRKQVSTEGTYPASPLGATPRKALPQKHLLSYISNSTSMRSSRGESKVNGHSSRSGFKSDVSFTRLKAKRETAAPLDQTSSTKSFILLGLIFVGSLVSLALVYHYFPKLEESEKQHIKLPKDIEDAKNLGKVLYRYKDKYYYQVLGGYFIIYIFLQSFAIPGSIFLSILSGFLFPFQLALFLVCLCSGLGASFCYLLSYLVGIRLVQKYIPERVAEWRVTVNRHREHLMNYIIFLRITPFLPNWFINITSPVLNVPLMPFFVGTFIGVAPPSFVAIQAGTTLHQLTSSSEAISYTSMAVLGVLALVSLIPVFFKKTLQKKFS